MHPPDDARVEPAFADTVPDAPPGLATPVPAQDPTAMPMQAGARPPRASSNWFVRHWRGELPLPVSFWVVGVLLANAFQALLVITTRGEPLGDEIGLRASAAVGLGTMAAWLAVLVWSWGGILRSAGRHVARGGHAPWAALARAAVGLAMFSYLSGAVQWHLADRAIELGRLASGHDDLRPIEVALSPDGRTLGLRGELGLGSEERVARALAQAPGLRTVMLDSRGGRLHEGRAIARLVRARRLDTYVEGLCASACTMVFLAGADRGATPNARIGFHRPVFAGMDLLDTPETRELMQEYRDRGLPEAFLEHVRNTPSSGMWFPTHEELMASHVVTRTSMGGENALSFAGLDLSDPRRVRAQLESVEGMAGIEARFPGTLDTMVDRLLAARRAGAGAAQAIAAARGVYVSLLPRAMATASDDALVEYATVVRDEMRAALSVGPQACARLLAGSLDIGATLPGDLARRELRASGRIMGETPGEGFAPPRQLMASSLGRAMARVAPELRVVLQQPRKYEDEPVLRCEAFDALFTSALALPGADRGLAIRGVFVH